MANTNFAPTSRYYNVPTKVLETPDGESVVYLARRFVPLSSTFALLHYHTVRAGERLDVIAAAELGDPEAFWRIADANDAIRPDALTERVRRRLRITLPEGVPAAPSA
jgi:hypothetical protein